MSTPATPAQWRAALKAEGVAFTEFAGWTTRGRDAATGKIFGPVHGVLNHHTAGANSLATIATAGRPGLPPPLAHAYLPKNGVVVLVADGRANHAGLVAKNVFNAIVAEKPLPKQDKSQTVDGNDSLYGLEVENLGDGKDAYTRSQYDRWVRFNAALCRLHGWSVGSVAGHLETSVEGKPDPAGPVAGYGRRGPSPVPSYQSVPRRLVRGRGTPRGPRAPGRHGAGIGDGGTPRPRLARGVSQQRQQPSRRRRPGERAPGHALSRRRPAPPAADCPTRPAGRSGQPLTGRRPCVSERATILLSGRRNASPSAIKIRRCTPCWLAL
ncbi:N-acetylmuramoyl-L-alanine amidase [Streptomyces sp. NPDC090798]|uniref:peptidoglycan recognition protein family protein n=1 Tax=Streptomyces sp. NPDC090798 TaxID=3365968 RepID=UPI00382D3F78